MHAYLHICQVCGAQMVSCHTCSAASFLITGVFGEPSGVTPTAVHSSFQLPHSGHGVDVPVYMASLPVMSTRLFPQLSVTCFPRQRTGADMESFCARSSPTPAFPGPDMQGQGQRGTSPMSEMPPGSCCLLFGRRVKPRFLSSWL
jgi:hypothetical protein